LRIFMKKNLTSFTVLIIFFVFLSIFTQKSNLNNIKEIKIAGQSIKVDLAFTPTAQEQGLSGRSNLKEDEDMLFVFDKPGQYPFWMKDMNFAIDIIWIGEDLRVVYIKKNALPESYPESYGSNGTSKYVLEVGAGFSDKNNLKVGDKIDFVYR